MPLRRWMRACARDTLAWGTRSFSVPRPSEVSSLSRLYSAGNGATGLTVMSLAWPVPANGAAAPGAR